MAKTRIIEDKWTVYLMIGNHQGKLIELTRKEKIFVRRAFKLFKNAQKLLKKKYEEGKK